VGAVLNSEGSLTPPIQSLFFKSSEGRRSGLIAHLAGLEGGEG
jgi:hypothetical protein